MFLFKIDNEIKDQYKYQQIYTNFKELILNRTILPGEKLPPKRKLAKDLKVSINCVANAYEQLLAEGYINAVERSGYYVEDIAQFANKAKQDEVGQFPEDLKEEEESKEGVLSLSHMATDLSLFPFNEWLKSEKIAFNAHMEDMSHISHPQGPYKVRATIARLISLNRGVSCRPEQIVIGPGTQPLMRQILTMGSEFKSAGIENPGYHRMYKLFEGLGLDVAAITLDEAGVDIAEVKQKNPNILFITPSHQFPTGKIMPISRRIELLNWASEADDRYILEDDYDSEFKYGTDNIPSLQSLDRNNKVIYSGTFSKTLSSSLRISYMVLPPNLLKKYRETYSTWIQGSSTLNLYTLNYFIENGEYAKHLKRLNMHYEKIRSKFIADLKKAFGKQVFIYDIPAGLHFYAEFETKKTYIEIEAAAERERLEVYTMRRFDLANRSPESERIGMALGFAKLNEENIKEAVDTLKKIII
ncbi:PLP-dependent aminotransferase family protein [Salinicoccus roseus]|uniref:MocR-like transcriptional regulator GabR n=1 Tax=Salinicoccus roseus TaxID=45670 RepID=UPI002301204E|nr:PLP-dependent aminotransferase family protein [Salinicoccus roseus]